MFEIQRILCATRYIGDKKSVFHARDVTFIEAPGE